jgi:hypothetical protein
MLMLMQMQCNDGAKHLRCYMDYDLVLLPLMSTSTPSPKPCVIFTCARARERPPRAIAQEVPKAK